jgi:pyrimidine-nucleoside phosphorylase
MEVFLSLIERKRDGGVLSDAEWKRFVGAVVAGQLETYQITAFLMAILFRGLDVSERRSLTLAMRDSGEMLEFACDPGRPVVDKHSTGGVGDKVSLPLAPLLAALGFRVPMISGRGLGITGGTLDKLSAIPGFTTALPRPRILELVETLGVAMAGQTERMVPADRILYALRDASGSVPSLDLITASILSKKLAEGLDALVLDVKFGSAAFMPTQARGRDLARALVSIATECGVRTRAVLTDMNTPLGLTAGNWLEVKESEACLRGGGPADLRELVIDLAAHVLVQTAREASLERARHTATTCLDGGAAHGKWRELISAQGGRLDDFERLLAADSLAPVVLEVRSDRSGFVTRCDARVVGEVVRDLGGGRHTRDSVVDVRVGIDRLAKPGTRVRAGDLLGRIHAESTDAAEEAARRFREAIDVGDSQPDPGPLIHDVMLAGD